MHLKKRKEHSLHEIIIHPTQKPVELTNRLICSCKPKDKFNVLIPFCGSGSGCECTLRNGGNFISYELNEEYIILAKAVTNREKDLGAKKSESLSDTSHVS